MIYVILAIAGLVVIYAVGLPAGGVAVGIAAGLIMAILRALRQKAASVFSESPETAARH